MGPRDISALNDFGKTVFTLPITVEKGRDYYFKWSSATDFLYSSGSVVSVSGKTRIEMVSREIAVGELSGLEGI